MHRSWRRAEAELHRVVTEAAAAAKGAREEADRLADEARGARAEAERCAVEAVHSSGAAQR